MFIALCELITLDSNDYVLCLQGTSTNKELSLVKESNLTKKSGIPSLIVDRRANELELTSKKKLGIKEIPQLESVAFCSAFSAENLETPLTEREMDILSSVFSLPKLIETLTLAGVKVTLSKNYNSQATLQKQIAEFATILGTHNHLLVLASIRNKNEVYKYVFYNVESGTTLYLTPEELFDGTVQKRKLQFINCELNHSTKTISGINGFKLGEHAIKMPQDPNLTDYDVQSIVTQDVKNLTRVILSRPEIRQSIALLERYSENMNTTYGQMVQANRAYGATSKTSRASNMSNSTANDQNQETQRAEKPTFLKDRISKEQKPATGVKKWFGIFNR